MSAHRSIPVSRAKLGKRRLLPRSRRCRRHDIPPVRAGHLHPWRRETRAAPVPRVDVKRPPPDDKWGGGAGAARGCTPGGTSDRSAELDGRHLGWRARRRHGLMAAPRTQLKFIGHYGYGCLPPLCRPSTVNVGLLAEGRPDSEPLRMRAYDPKCTFTLPRLVGGYANEVDVG